MKPQKTVSSQSKLEKEKQGGGIMFPDFKLYSKTS